MRIMPAFWRLLISLVLIEITLAGLTGRTALAQDLDQGKSAQKLFAGGCSACHRSPRGLAKGRISWTLSSFLRQHYTSSPESAQVLTAYLQSVDAPPARPKPAAARRGRPQTAGALSPPLRPPAPVPRR
jgi:mono/diheme cytochrome c family protein